MVGVNRNVRVAHTRVSAASGRIMSEVMFADARPGGGGCVRWWSARGRESVSEQWEGVMRRVVLCAAVVCALASLLVPAAADAQKRASIIGVVQDSSSAVLPGVTVEAASPALIERVRSGVTDGSGRF